jgi:serine phosphatase RsbU (regulator of sigma subunit)
MSLTTPETGTLQDSAVGTPVSTAGYRLPNPPPRPVQLAIAFVLFCILDLILIPRLAPPDQQGIAVISSMLGALVVVLVVCFLPLFERQQEQIELQTREIETLHAMDTAIVSELDLPRLLEVAVRHAVRAVDGEAAGVAIFHPETGKLVAEYLTAVGLADSEAERLRHITRSGGSAEEDLWETMIIPLMAGSDAAQIIDKRSDNAAGSTSAPEPTGYLMAARRRQATRVFTDADRSILEALGNTVDVAVTNVRVLEAARETVQVRTELARERRVAQVLTEGLLPDIPSQEGRWRFAKSYKAQSDESLVGGDIYDLFRLGTGHWGVVIADVSGKGLAAAKKTAMVKYSLRSYAREHSSPGKVLARLNSALFDEENMTGFVTLFYGVLEEKSGILEYASAGHETPILHRADGTFEMLEPTGLVLGAAPDQEYDTDRVTLHPGDGLLLFTDGLTEARALGTGELLELPGVLSILANHRGASEGKMVPDIIWDSVTEYTGGVMRDDAAILWLECCFPAESEQD